MKWPKFIIKIMANISNMRMTNRIKGLVSKRRIRYTEDGFDLDLAYITDNLIAMGFPADKFEGVYRNHIDDVKKFLEIKHNDHYKIYNLCSERSYDVSKFKQRVAKYPFDDHNPPKIEVIRPFCEDVHNWLSRDPKNVAVVHCKAGKGRTGVMVSCYLLHAGISLTASEALEFYARKRTRDTKGVTIPSQRRYVGYYAINIKENLEYKPVSVVLRELRLEPLPNLFNGTQGSIHFVISEGNKMKGTKIFSGENEVKKGATNITIALTQCAPVQGDIKIEFFSKQKLRKDKLFHFWFNTFFVRDELRVNGNCDSTVPERSLSCDERGGTQENYHKPRANSLTNLETDQKSLILRIDKMDLDVAHKDKCHKLFPLDFRVNVIMARIGPRPNQSPLKNSSNNSSSHINADSNLANAHNIGSVNMPSTPSECSDNSSRSSTSDEEDAWESVEASSKSAVSQVGRYRLLSESELMVTDQDTEIYTS